MNSLNIHGEKYRTDICYLNKILVLLIKSFVKQKAITITNRFVGKTENLLGKQKSFVSSISTIWLVNTTILFSPCESVKIY